MKSLSQMSSKSRTTGSHSSLFIDGINVASRYTTEVTSSKTSYGLIPKDHWHQPSWIDEDKARKARKDMENNKVIYGGELALSILTLTPISKGSVP